MADSKVSLGEGKCTRATDKAILVELETGDDPLWIPSSVLHDDSEVYQTGQQGEVVVLQWWAEKNGHV